MVVCRGDSLSPPESGSSCWRAQLLNLSLASNQFLFPPQLEIFLSQRTVEMSEEADILSVSQFQLAPAILQGQTKEKMLSLVSTLQDLIGRLTSLRMQHLFMILASPRLAFLILCFSMLNGALPLSSSSSVSLPSCVLGFLLGIGRLFGTG